jgi:hypothetical protein
MRDRSTALGRNLQRTRPGVKRIAEHGMQSASRTGQHPKTSRRKAKTEKRKSETEKSKPDAPAFLNLKPKT